MNKILMTLVLASSLATHHSHTAAEAAAQEQVFTVVPYVNAVEEFVCKQRADKKNNAQPVSQQAIKALIARTSSRKFIPETSPHENSLPSHGSIARDQIGLFSSGISITIRPDAPEAFIILTMKYRRSGVPQSYQTRYAIRKTISGTKTRYRQAQQIPENQEGIPNVLHQW